jgi:hypothetical protein
MLNIHRNVSKIHAHSTKMHLNYIDLLCTTIDAHADMIKYFEMYYKTIKTPLIYIEFPFNHVQIPSKYKSIRLIFN